MEGGELQQYLPFTVLKLRNNNYISHNRPPLLQQYLPFTVLKLNRPLSKNSRVGSLQQYLPFTVLKLTIRFL